MGCTSRNIGRLGEHPNCIGHGRVSPAQVGCTGRNIGRLGKHANGIGHDLCGYHLTKKREEDLHRQRNIKSGKEDTTVVGNTSTHQSIDEEDGSGPS